MFEHVLRIAIMENLLSRMNAAMNFNVVVLEEATLTTHQVLTWMDLKKLREGVELARVLKGYLDMQGTRVQDTSRLFSELSKCAREVENACNLYRRGIAMRRSTLFNKLELMRKLPNAYRDYYSHVDATILVRNTSFD